MNRTPRLPVHPHARGEHGRLLPTSRTDDGSSPRPWGTRTLHQVIHRSMTVHPHARGEHSKCSPAVGAATGSSPRPWGTLAGTTTPRHRPGFIPTPVGNTSLHSKAWLHSSVHPHARGEHPWARRRFKPSSGSSPRPWGTLRIGKIVHVVLRFIPTPVGNTFVGRYSTRAPPVHPHARGEHSRTMKSPRAESGSSPRPWGTHLGEIARFV